MDVLLLCLWQCLDLRQLAKAGLALGELALLAGFLEAELLAFFFAGVAAEEFSAL